ncbi:hypothetical protein Poli38472_003108 [Pythium oligandrum]|uniref:Protein kinase domain-containing protein n=1 Tax=Pythium oligandrum TaxID=41045 RepID=A0A8K1C678_PYTOL|nr:hypothetical protein Poli38472_003108 [Pythium oligandrum]|eukprot:TMW57183.1 hypothetical protein Poli38472_003108 [Pythium oligandrum]
MGDMVVKHVTGKIKVEIQATPVKPPAPPPVETKPIGGRSLFPGNLGEALQLKRKQLRATVEPELVNSAVVRKEDDPEQAVKLLVELQGRFEGYMFQMDQLEVKQTIGEGVHAAVYHVRIRKGEDGMEEAAMKEFRYHPTSHGSPPILVLQAFRQEVEMLLRTSRDSNNYLIRFVGVILAPRLAIITEFCADGSLATCMQDSERWPRVTTRTKLVIARQIASGLATLHRQHIVHRDIKPHNVMIRALQSDEPTAKIGDLGSAIARNPASNVHEETGSAGYTAPEVFLPTGYDESADIWSYGIVVWEMMTRDSSLRRDGNPFRSLCGDDVVTLVRQDVRPALQPEHSICRELVGRCWSFDPSKRPSADDVVDELDHILARIH